MAGESLSGDLNGVPDPNVANANTRVIGVKGIAPTLGAQALEDGAQLGVGPDTAMRTSEATAPLAQSNRNAAVIASSPPVRDFLNNTNDAHVAVVQNDLPGLAKVGQLMAQYAASGGPIGDVISAAQSSAESLKTNLATYYKAASTPKVGDFSDIPAAVKAGGSVLGLLGSPFAAITEPLARGEAAIPLPMYVNGKPLTDFDAKLEQARKDIGLAMFAIGPKGEGTTIPRPTPEVPRIGVNPEMDTARGSVAAVDAAAMAHAQETVAATQTHSISPATMEEFLKQQPSERMVGVNPEALVQLQAEGHDPFPEHAADIRAAAVSGEDVEIPLSRYLTRTAGQPFAEQLNNATTFREGGTSVDEATEGGGGSGAQIAPALGTREDLIKLGNQIRAKLPEDDGVKPPEELPSNEELATLIQQDPELTDLANRYDKLQKQLSFREAAPLMEEVAAQLPPGYTVQRIQNITGNDDGPYLRYHQTKVGVFNPEGGHVGNVQLPVDMKSQWFQDILAGKRVGSVHERALAAMREEEGAPANDTDLDELAQILEEAGPKGREQATVESINPRTEYLAENSREEMEKVVKAQFLQPLFKDPAAIGMTKGQFERYNAQIEDAIATASDKALQRAYDQIRRERTPEWKDAVAQHSAAVEQEFARLPAVRARAALMANKGPLGEPLETPGLKLDKADALALWGKDLGLPDRMFSKNGVSPDEAAAVFGYPSGADMLRDLDALNRAQGDRSPGEHFKAAVRAEAENRARAQLGFTVDPEEMYNEASRLLNGPKVTDFLATELQHLAEAAGLPFDKARIKALAQERFAAKPVSEALNLKKLEGFVYKGGVKAEKALLKGDAATAFLRKQQQFIHHLQLAEAHKFAKYWGKTQRQWNRVAKKVTLKGTGQDALNWSKDIVASTGQQVKGNPVDLTRPINGFSDLGEFIAAKNGEGADIPRAPIPFGTAARDMTVEQYRGVADMVAAIMKWGREENQVTVAGEKRELREMLDEGIASLMRYTRTISDRELSNPTMMERIDAARRVADALLVRNEQLMRDFGARDPNSPFFQIVSRRLQERKGWSEDTRTELAKHFHELNDAVGPGFGRWLRAKLPSEGPHTSIVTSDGSPLFNTNKDIMMAALHMGDIEALDKFARGYNTTPEAIEAAVYANARPQMWTAVQGIWDSFARLKPDIEAMYRRITGVTPRMVEARPFTTPDGLELKGGYFPVMYDTSKMPKDWIRQEDPTSMLGSPHYVRATPSNRYIEARTGVAAPIQMDLRSVYSRLNQVVHDLAYREVLADMNKFLLHPDMVAAITHKYGPEYVDKLRSDIKDIAGSESVNPNDTKIGIALDYLTEGQMINMIGFSLKTMAKHGITAQFQAPSEVGLARYVASLQRVLLEPVKYTRIANEESHDVRHILSTINEDSFRQFMALQQGKSGWSRTALSYAFHFVAASNKFVAVPLYDAAKTYVMDKYPTLDAESVKAAAGQIVRQALGSSGPTDAPKALRMDNGLWGRLGRLTNPFLTFLSHMYNKQREIPQAFGYAGEKPDIGRGLGVLFASVLVPIYVEQAIEKKTLSMGKKALDFFSYWAEGLLHQEAGGVPVVNTAVAAAAKHIWPHYPGGEGGITSIFDAQGQVIKDVLDTTFKHKPWTDKQTKHALIAGGYLGRYPGVVAARVEGAVSKVLRGKEGPFEAMHEMVFGEKAKEH